jgi:hypothetical protein
MIDAGAWARGTVAVLVLASAVAPASAGVVTSDASADSSGLANVSFSVLSDGAVLAGSVAGRARDDGSARPAAIADSAAWIDDLAFRVASAPPLGADGALDTQLVAVSGAASHEAVDDPVVPAPHLVPRLPDLVGPVGVGELGAAGSLVLAAAAMTGFGFRRRRR